jgi:uracil phosphoribosyltransferase
MTIHVVDHPLVQHKLSLIRDRKTAGSLFRALIEEVGLILATESTRSLPTESVVVETPLERTSTLRLKSLDPVLVPVLRAGLGHDSLVPVPYYRNFPPLLEARPVFVLDPMLATGGSASEAVRQLKAAGAVNLTLVALLAAPEGLERLQQEHPDLTIVVGAVDRQLNEKGYILPGLGDAGDRLFGTA